jgi:hypothetical protein
VTSLELHYVLRRIRSAQQDPELLARALVVYHTNTPQLEATATNEILYWADHYNEKHADELFLFSLEINNTVIGYAQCVSFVDQSFVIIDYMTVENGTRPSESSFFSMNRFENSFSRPACGSTS